MPAGSIVLNAKLTPSSMKRRILVIQPDLLPSGGGNAVAACLIEALKNENVLSVLSWAPPNIDAINRVFATSLKSFEFSTHSAPLFLRALAKLNPYFYSLRYGILLLLCKKMRNDYDIMISVNNEADFGCKGIQYVHDPPYWFYRSDSRSNLGVSLFLPDRLWTVFKGKYRPWMLIAGFSFDRMKKNVTLVNSHWTGYKLREVYGIASTTIYPPVLGSFPSVPWEERETGLVCIGRIIPWKRLEKIIEITEKVKTVIPEAHLHIVGRIEDRSYLHHVLSEVQDSSSIFLNSNVSREALAKLIASHRYGIHGMVNEPFGLAVAEMIHGGCIVFVPRSAGPMEIVGADDRLLYETTDEAARKIIHVIASPDEQESIRTYLHSRMDLFSREQFVQRIQQIVEQFPEPMRFYAHRGNSSHCATSNSQVMGHETK